MDTTSSSVNFATVGFISAVLPPLRVPLRTSWSCHSRETEVFQAGSLPEFPGLREKGASHVDSSDRVQATNLSLKMPVDAGGTAPQELTVRQNRAVANAAG